MEDDGATGPCLTAGVNHVAVITRDLDRAVEFWGFVLGAGFRDISDERGRHGFVELAPGEASVLHLFEIRERLDARGSSTGAIQQVVGQMLSVHAIDPDGMEFEVPVRAPESCSPTPTWLSPGECPHGSERAERTAPWPEVARSGSWSTHSCCPSMRRRWRGSVRRK